MIYFALGGLGIGGLAGFLYWKKVGCVDGTCPSFTTKYSSIIYGAALGLFLAQQVFDWIN